MSLRPTSATFTYRRINALAAYTIGISAFIFLLLPIYWLVVTSFKPIESLFVVPPEMWSYDFTFQNYINQFSPGLIRLFRNILIVSGAAAVLSTFAGSLFAYAISRFYFRFKSALLLFFFGVDCVSNSASDDHHVFHFNKIGILDSYWALILGNTAMACPCSFG